MQLINEQLMKRTAGTGARVLSAWGMFAFVLPALAFQPPARMPLPDLDERVPAAAVVRVSPEQTRAAAALRGRLETIQVEFDRVTASPRSVSPAHGFLSGANGEGK